MSWSQPYERTVADLAEVLRDAKDRREPCSVLVGAGCSVTAGIPLASGFVQEVEKRYPEASRRAREKTYPFVMGALDSGRRYRLIADFVEKAKLNWGHLLLSWLMKNGYVGRVLTTNFDNLVVRSCSLYNVHPSVYDLAASTTFRASLVRDPSVFYLHGQFGGFVQLHTPDELAKHTLALRPAFDDASVKRPWLVVGYSGNTDPVFENLVGIDHFVDGLYWVPYRDHDPGEAVRTRLFSPTRQAYLVRGYDADGFFIALFRALGLDAPPYVTDPFTHMIDLLEQFTPFPTDGSQGETDITSEPRRLLTEAKARFVEGRGTRARSRSTQGLDAKLHKLLLEGKHEEVIREAARLGRQLPTDAGETVSWAYFGLANGVLERSQAASPADRDELLTRAHRLYEQALQFKPDNHKVINSLGLVFASQARTRAGAEADQLFQLATEMYDRAFRIKGDDHYVLGNWGAVLTELAKTKTGTEADALFQLAISKYQLAFRLEPEDHRTLNNWGLALANQARIKAGTAADQLFQLATEKYDEALRIKPDYHRALYNWGNALASQAKLRSGADAEQLFRLASDKLRRALRIDPADPSVLYNLACLEAAQGRVVETLTWLDRRKGAPPPLTAEKLNGDRDFDAVRGDPRFQAFITSLQSAL